MKQRFKRTLSLVLALVMVLSCMSMGAMASYSGTADSAGAVASITSGESTYYYTSLAAAVADAQSGDTITLLADVKNENLATSSVINIALPAGVTLDGNGHELSGNVTVTVNAGGGTVKNVVFKDIHNNAAISESDRTKYGFNRSTGNLTALYASRLTGELTITGCMFENSDWESIQITPKTGAEINITGNTFRHIDNDKQLRYIHIETPYDTSQNDTGWEKIKVTVKDNIMDAGYVTSMGIWYFTDDSTLDVSKNYIAEANSWSISTGKPGGNYGHLAYPYYTELTSDGKIDTSSLTGSPVAAIIADKWNAAYYATLAEAIEHVGSGDTITMIANEDNAKGMSVAGGKNFTIDFNGKTYTVCAPGAGSTGTETQAFQFLKDSTITLKNGTIRIAEANRNYEGDQTPIKRIINNYADLTLDNMKIYTENIYGDAADRMEQAVNMNHGKMTLKSGTQIIAPELGAGENDHILTAYDWSTNSAYPSGSHLVIEDATVNGTVAFGAYSDQRFASTLEITGGTFGGLAFDGVPENVKQHVTITGGTFGSEVSAYVADGYIAYDNVDGTYTVAKADAAAKIGNAYYETLADAVNAADNDTVQLLKSVTEKVAISTGKTLTLDLNGFNITSTDKVQPIKVNNGTKLTITNTNTGKAENTAAQNAILGPSGTDNYGSLAADGEDTTVDIHAGYYYGYNGQKTAINAINGATVTFYGGVVNGAEGINDTTASKEGKVFYSGVSNPTKPYATNPGYIVVHGGTFSGRMSDSNWGNYLIDGGTFDRNEVVLNENPVDEDGKRVATTSSSMTSAGTGTFAQAGWLAPGYEAVENTTNSTWTVQKSSHFYLDDAKIWHINDLAGLEMFRNSVNSGKTYSGEKVVLDANITLTSAWTPIGYSERHTAASTVYSTTLGANPYFAGTFDGNGKTISGLTNIGYTPDNNTSVNDDGEYVYGLFGVVGNGAVIKDVTLDYVSIDASENGNLKGDSVGALVGYSFGGTTVSGVTVNGTIKGHDGVGAIVGRIYQGRFNEAKTVSLTGNTATATVSGDGTTKSKVSGLFGYVADHDGQFVLNLTVTDNTFNGTVSNDVAFSSPIMCLNTQLKNKNTTIISGNKHGTLGTVYQSTTVDGSTLATYVDAPAVAEIVGGAKYETLAAAINAAQDGNTVTLLSDLALTERLFINAGATPAYAGTNNRYATTSENKAITLDLNDHSITSTSNIALAGGSLNVTGSGTISTSASGLAPIEVRGTGDLTAKRTLTIGSGVTLTGPEYGLNVFGSNEKNGVNKIEVNVNGTINGCVFVLGNLQNTSNEIVINVNNGATVSTVSEGSDNSDQAIANNGYATVNIKSGAIVTGKSTGIETRAGTLNIEKGATVTGNGDVTASSPNGSGCTTTGAGVAVAQHTTKLPTTLNITGGTITGKTALYITNPQSNVTVNVSASVSGGTFNGGVSTTTYNATTGKAVESKDDRVTGFITGGIYSTEPDSSYVASGYKAVALTSGDNSGKYQVGVATITPSTIGTTTDTSVTYTVNTTVKDTADPNKTLEEKTNLQVTVTANTTTTTTDAGEAAKSAAALTNIAGDEVLSNIVSSAIEAAGASITSSTESANITIQLAKSAAEATTDTSDTTKVTKVTYEVHPEAVISVGENVVGTVELANSQITGSFSFKLYALNITDVAVGDKIKVTHIHDDGTSEELGPFTVHNDGYIEVTGVTEFSEFELEEVTVDTTHYADYGYTLALEDSINIVFNVKNLAYTPSDYTVEYTFKDVKSSTKLSRTDLNSITVASCAAKEMGETVHIVVKYQGAGIKAVDLSVKGYCDSYIAANENNASKQYLVNLCKATLDYGRYAQETFNYKTSNLVNGGSDYFTNANITVPTYSYFKDGNRPDGITGESASLITTSATQLVVYFAYSGESAGYTVKVGDWNEKTGEIENESVVSNWTTENGKIKVVITGIAAKNLGVKKAVTISVGDNSYVLKFSPVDYMGLQVNYFGNQVNINRAFYNYYIKAADYLAHK